MKMFRLKELILCMHNILTTQLETDYGLVGWSLLFNRLDLTIAYHYLHIMTRAHLDISSLNKATKTQNREYSSSRLVLDHIVESMNITKKICRVYQCCRPFLYKQALVVYLCNGN